MLRRVKTKPEEEPVERLQQIDPKYYNIMDSCKALSVHVIYL